MRILCSRPSYKQCDFHTLKNKLIWPWNHIEITLVSSYIYSTFNPCGLCSYVPSFMKAHWMVAYEGLHEISHHKCFWINSCSGVTSLWGIWTKKCFNFFPPYILLQLDAYTNGVSYQFMVVFKNSHHQNGVNRKISIMSTAVLYGHNRNMGLTGTNKYI